VNHNRHQLVRRVSDPVTIEAQDVRRLGHRPEHRTRYNLRAQRHAAELELSDYPEIATAPAYSPEKISIPIRTGLSELAVGCHKIN